MRVLYGFFALLLSSVAATCVQADAPASEVLARIEGVEVRESDLQQKAQSRLKELREEKLWALKAEQQRQIRDAMVRLEAEKRGTTMAALLDDEIVQKTPMPSEEEILQFYKMNGSLEDIPFGKARASIEETIYRKQEELRTNDFMETLQQEWQIVTNELTDAHVKMGNDEDYVIASVANQKIYLRDLRIHLSVLFYRIDQEIYLTQRRYMDIKANDLLLQRESASRGLTTKALLDSVFTSGPRRAATKDAMKFYEDNRERFQKDYSTVESEILQYLNQEQSLQVQQAFAAELRQKWNIETFLQAPGELIYPFDEKDQPAQGPADAAVTVTVFQDFACSRCAEVHSTLEELIARFGADAVRLVARDLPLPKHPNAFRAAEAAEVARSFGQYWEYAELLFAQDSGLEDVALIDYAARIGIDRDDFSDRLSSGQYQDPILADLEDSAHYGLNSAPSVFVNGRKMESLELESLETTISDFLAAHAEQVQRLGLIVPTEETKSCCSAKTESDACPDMNSMSDAANDVTRPTADASEQASGELAMASVPLKIPNTPVLDQNGRKLNFYDDLIKDKTVAIQFIFTSCKTICPPLTANMQQVQELLPRRDDLALISISVDPTTDRPDRLKEFAELFGAQDGWTFVTGEMQEINNLLTRLGAFSDDKFDHTPMMVIYDDHTKNWTRTYGLAEPAKLAAMIEKFYDARPTLKASLETETLETTASSAIPFDESTKISPREQASRQFPNVQLVTHEGQQVRFFDDLLQGKTVILNVMFTSCTGICPPMTKTLAKVQEYLGDLVGTKVNILSISIDPELDTIEALHDYAEDYGAGPGWYFLRGERDEVEALLSRFGNSVEDKFNHSTYIFMGNVETGNWSRMLAVTDAAEIANEVRGLVAATIDTP